MSCVDINLNDKDGIREGREGGRVGLMAADDQIKRMRQMLTNNVDQALRNLCLRGLLWQSLSMYGRKCVRER